MTALLPRGRDSTTAPQLLPAFSERLVLARVYCIALLRWRVPRISNNNARYKMMHQFVFILLKSKKRKLVRHNTKHNTISLT